MSKRKLGAASAGTMFLLKSGLLIACPRDGTPGPCHCGQMLMNQWTSTPLQAPAQSSASSNSTSRSPLGVDSETDVHVFNFDFSTNPSGMPIMDATIQLGDTIHWEWDDGTHSVTSVAGSLESFDSGDLTGPGSTFDHTFDHAGVFTYYCNIHGFDFGNGTAGGMSGTITVLGPTVQWNVDGSGDWNSTTNWSGDVPNGVDAVANFLGAISSAQTVFTNTAITVGTLKFDNPNSYQITGQGSLTLQASVGSATLNVAQGTPKINLPLFFASDTNVTVAAGATLTIANPTTIRANKTVTESGNVVISAPLILESGASLVNASGSLGIFGAPTLSGNAKVDVQTNQMVVDYRGQADPSSTIKLQLTGAYTAGAWSGSGITTSSSIAGKTGVGWKNDAASQSILVKYTYYGDADLDGQVTTADFTTMAAHFNSAGVWSQGDFNYDGVINALDFNALASNFGSTLPGPGPALGALLPEPASLGSIALIVMLFPTRARRRPY